jgi:hypothetical protein
MTPAFDMMRAFDDVGSRGEVGAGVLNSTSLTSRGTLGNDGRGHSFR